MPRRKEKKGQHFSLRKKDDLAVLASYERRGSAGGKKRGILLLRKKRSALSTNPGEKKGRDQSAEVGKAKTGEKRKKRRPSTKSVGKRIFFCGEEKGMSAREGKEGKTREKGGSPGAAVKREVAI